MGMAIAIDGPAGAGKSTIAKLVAKKKQWIYVDTGAMYRAFALYYLRKGVDPDNEAQIAAQADGADIRISYKDGAQVVTLNGEDVTGLLRTEEVGNAASKVSRVGEVRRKLVELQRKLAEDADVVMDGRDIGTAVLPNAQVKIYLTADAHVRALRRYRELAEKKLEADKATAGEKKETDKAATGEIDEAALAKIEADIIERDRQDMTRAISPLTQAKDAVYLDSSALTIDEVVEKILSVCGEKTA